MDLLKMRGQISTYAPIFNLFHGDLPWYNVKNQLKRIQTYEESLYTLESSKLRLSNIDVLQKNMPFDFQSSAFGS